MHISRRRFTQIGFAGTAVAVGGGLWLGSRSRSFGQARFINPLNIPPLLEGTPKAGRKHYDLTAQAGRTEFFEGVTTSTIGVNGPYLGPTVKFHAGDKVTMNVTNRLNGDTTLHWHGLHLPAAADGGPHQVIRPGETWSPEFEIKQKAAQFWYHSHQLRKTGEQVNLGLAGLILVEDDEASALDLPKAYGIDDIPLVIQDRRFRADGSLAYAESMHDIMAGFKGDTILVNGTLRPHLQLHRKVTRLRLLNGSNSRIYNFGFDDARRFVQIASDGSLLARPVSRKRLRLAPGERAEIVVDFEPDSSAMLMSYPDEARGRGMMGPMMGRMAGNNETFAILKLSAGRIEGAALKLPEILIDVPNWDEAHAERIRRFELTMGMMGGMMGGRGMMGGGMGGRGMMGGGGMRGRGMMGGAMGINGRSMEMSRIDERVPLGAVEVWSISNPTPLAHPFHIHDIQFRILDRNGRRSGAHEAGLKDTVLVDPGETVRVITQFADYADEKKPYMYHCHILEHEDAGMMGQFVVTA